MTTLAVRGNQDRAQWSEGILPSTRAGRPRSAWLAIALLLIALVAPLPSQAASALAELIAAAQTSDEFDPGKVAAVYRETVLSGDGIDRALARLKAFSRQPDLSLAAQANLYLAVAHLQWRDGEIDQAVASADKALEIAPTADTLLLKARLLDTGGEAQQARYWYRRAAEAFGEGDEQWLVQTRLAMMEVGGRSVEAVEELANRRGQGFRNQAAVVLALLGHPERAIKLYKPGAGDGRLYRQHLRLAEWALQAEEHELARKQAWLAYVEAEIRVDRLYALALLTESYRKAEELDALLEDLEQRDPGDQELLRLRVETLIETEGNAQAIELYRQLEVAEADISERRRLVSLYEAAGDTDAMVREYERMMEAEPGQVQWYDGLAAHYLNLADNDSALEVWSTLESRNPERAEILVEAAGLMLQMGFMDEGVALVARHMQAYGPDVGGLFFLFDAWLDKGQDGKALEMLVRLEEHLPPNAAERRDLADAYERLSRPQEALRVFEAIRDSEGGLGYDEKMRLAWLYTLVDRKDEALKLWRDIWVGVESPARRSFAESQLLLLAAELGALGDMAVELEGMLIEGTANRNHMNLLVRIYTEVGDKLSATGIIDDYAGAMGEDEIGRQELLAQVFMLLEDYPARDKALRRLYEIDSANRVDHIKSIIINLLTFDLATESDERFEEINRWIGELRRFDAEAVSGEFEASIYSMAGFGEQAIESYRRALVEQPENSDNLLLLADVLKSNGRTDEAVAILQFFAEHAAEDSEFVVAVDGIINMIGAQTFFQQPDPEAVSRLDWTRRVILERIAGRANRFYLYELLADIAREMGDTEGSFLALENSLAEAGLRRPAILRELLTMSTPNAGFSGFNTGAGDIERQLKHGRRLVGLRQQLPPEVYIDIGKSLLSKDDVSGAERAFEMIDDITGLIDVNRTKAEIFEEEGYGQESREYYNRALNVNRDSLELLHKTGFLYEADGREEIAFRRYLKAIGGLLRRQATELAAGAPPIDPNSWQAMLNQRTDTTVSREFREHYASLEQGLLLNWPEDPEESSRAVAELKALFDGELRNVLDRSGGDLVALARYARLDRAARLIRRVGFYRDDAELAQYADLRLLTHFSADEAFAEHLDKQYGDAGRPRPLAGAGREGVAAPDNAAQDARAALTPLRKQLELAASRDDFETQLQLLRLEGATEELEALLGERILAGRYRDGLGYALALLDEREFKSLATAVAPKLMQDGGALLALLGSDAELFLQAEDVAGRPLIPARDIIALLISPEAWDQSGSLITDTSGFWDYLEARASADDRIRYIQALAGRFGRGTMFSGEGINRPFRQLLKERLNARQRRETAAAVIDYLSGMDVNNETIDYLLIEIAIVLDARPENAEVLYRIAEFIQDRWPASPGVKPLLEALYEERSDEAFRQYVEIQADMPQTGFGLVFSVPGLFEALAAPRSRFLDEVASGRRVDPKMARAAYEMEFPPFPVAPIAGERLGRQAELLQRLREMYGEEDVYRHELIAVWLSLGYSARAGQAIADKYRADPEDESWRVAWFLLLVSQQRFAEAQAVAADGGPDLRDFGVVRETVNRVTRRGRNPGQAAVWRIVARLYGYSPIARAAALRVASPTGGKAASSAVERLREALASGNHKQGRMALREVWRRLLAGQRSPYNPFPGGMHLQTAVRLLSTPLQVVSQSSAGVQKAAGQSTVSVAAAGQSASELVGAGRERPKPRMLFGAVAEAPYGAAELGGYLRAMPDEARKGFHPLYGYLARAAGAREGGSVALRDLWAGLRAQELSDHDFTLWMLLRDQAKVDFGPGGLEAFQQRVTAMYDPAPYQLLLAARVFATAGAFKKAVEHYKLVAARRIQHGEYADRQTTFFAFGFGAPGFSDLSALVDEAAERLPLEAAREVVEAVLMIARRAEGLPGADMLFDALVLSSLDKLYPPEELLWQAKQRSAGALDLPDSPFGLGGAKAIELVRACARSGDLNRAMEILAAILKNPGPKARHTMLSSSRREYENAVAIRALSQLYGIRFFGNPYGAGAQSHSGARELLFKQARIFPMNAEDWPGASEWTGAVTEALLGWLEGGEVDPEQALQLLMAAGMRHMGPMVAGETGQSTQFLRRVLGGIAASGRPLNANGLTMLASMARGTGSSVPFEWVADMFMKGGLTWQQQRSLLRMYADSSDADKLLELTRASGLDRGLEVLRQLRAMAETSADTAYANELKQRIEREEAAEKALFAE